MPRAKRTPVAPANSQQQFGFHDRETATPAHDELTVWLHKNCQPMFQHLFGGPFSEKTATLWWSQAVEKIAKYRDGWLSELRETEKAKDLLRTPEAFENWRLTDLRRLVANEATLRALVDQPNTFPPLPEKPPIEVSLKLEKPILRPGSNFMVGVADAVVNWSHWRLVPEDEGYLRGCYSAPRKPFAWTIFDSERVAIVELKPKINSLGELLRQVNVYGSAIPDALIVIVSPDEQYREILEDQDVRFVAPREITGGD